MNASDSESSYCVGSLNSSSVTDISDIPPGRLLGKSYVFLGRKAENCLSMAAEKLGFGPRPTAMRIRRLIQKNDPLESSNCKQLKNAARRLVKYAR